MTQIGLTLERSESNRFWRSAFLALAVAASAMTMLIAGPMTGAAIAQDEPKEEVERPPMEDLLPETAVMVFKAENVRELAEKLESSSGGQMLADENIAPMVEGLWEEARTAYAEVEDEVGLSLEEIQSLPGGEISFAVLAPKRKDPVVVVMIEVDDENEAVDKALERGREQAEEDGAAIEDEENDDGIDITRINGGDGETFSMLRKDGLIVGCTDNDELEAIVDRWMGREVEKVRPLSSNRKYITIMNRCRGTSDLPPDFKFYVDPIGFAKAATRGEITAQVAINLLPVLGLDGLLAVGGSAIMNEQDFEWVMHAHALMANPKEGILKMIALKPASYEVEPWIPEDTASYITTSWNFDTFYTELSKILSLTVGENVMEDWIEENINSEIEMDLKEDIVDTLSGRVTVLQWIAKPIAVNSQVTALSIQMDDPEKASEVIESLVERINRDEEEGEENVEESEYKGVRFWTTPAERRERRMERMRERSDMQINFRTPQPCIGLIGDELLLTESVEFFQACVDTMSGERLSLAENEEFQAVQKKMIRLLDNDMPAAIMYSNPKTTMEAIFEFANGDDARTLLEDGEEDENKYLKGFKRVLRDNPLPEYKDVSKYFATSGGFVTSDETGYHLMTFQMKPDTDKEEDE